MPIPAAFPGGVQPAIACDEFGVQESSSSRDDAIRHIRYSLPGDSLYSSRNLGVQGSHGHASDGIFQSILQPLQRYRG